MRVLLTAMLLSAANASTVYFPGPINTAGHPCMPGDQSCIFGPASMFAIYGGTLTQPTGSNPWILTINTNYGAAILGNDIPSYPWNGHTFFMGDVLFTWHGLNYGVPLTPHDGYQPGYLYQAPGFQTSADVLGPGVSLRPFYPVLLAPGGQELGTGTLTIAHTGDGMSSPSYTLTEMFLAPVGFLATGGFTIAVSSAICANGNSSGGGSFDPVPEPATSWLGGISIGILLFARRARWRSH